MRAIGHRHFFDTLDELVHPNHTALLVVDMQNDFTHPDGYYARRGIDLTMIRAIVPKIQQLLHAARRAGVMVFYSVHTILPGYRSDSPLWLSIHAAAGLERLDQEDFYSLDGTWGQQIVDDLTPTGGDIVLKKFRANAFIGTPLDTLLRSNSIHTLVVTGQVTQGCVENTVRMARDLDYYGILVRDCVASTRLQNHEATLTNLSGRFPLPVAKELIAVWEGGA